MSRLWPRLIFSGVLLVLLLGGAELVARRAFRDALAPHPPISRNRLGFRDAEVGPKRPDRYRIIVVGDSFTFGDGIEERDRFSNLLQDQLGAGYQVVNFGTRAHNLPDHLRTLDRALKLSPDFVLLQLYENDFETRRMERPEAYTLLPERLDRRMTRQFVTYRIFGTAMVRIQQALGLSEEYSHYMARHLQDPYSPDASEAFGMLRSFIEKSRAAGVGVGTVLFPALWALQPGGRNYPFTYLHEHVGAICKEERLPCSDLYAEFAADPNPRHLWVSDFDAHPNAEANHRAARQILHDLSPAWHR